MSDQIMKTIDKKAAKHNKDNIIYTSYLETKKYILEQIINSECSDGSDIREKTQTSAFVKYSKSNGDVEIVKEVSRENKIYKPIIDDTLTMGGISLPTGVKEYKNTKEITDQIRQYLTERIQLPQKPINYEGFLPHLAMFYWVYEKFPFIPYIHFVGGTSTGKTTAMEIFGSICYKPVDSSSSLTIASMFRIATNWKGTLMIDEFEKIGERSQEIILFLKAGVSNRLLYRVEGKAEKELRAYVIKSPKMFTSEKPINDAGLQSRTIVIKMDKNTRRIPLYMLKEDYTEAQEIRNKLLLWRLRNLSKVNLKKIRYGVSALQPFDRRVQQIVTPIYYLSDKETRKNIIEFARSQEEETLRERRESLDGVLFEIITGIWESGEEAQLKAVTMTLNEQNKGAGYKKELTERKIGNIIRKVLGFETERRTGGTAWIVRNKEIEASKRDYYGVTLSSPTSLPSQSSLENQDNGGDKDAEEI